MPASAFIVTVIIAGLIADAVIVHGHSLKLGTFRQLAAKLSRFPWTWKEGAVACLFILAGYLLLGITAADSGGVGLCAGLPVLDLVRLTAFIPLSGLLGVVILLGSRRLSWNSAFGFELRSLGRDARSAMLFYLAAVPPSLIAAVAYWMLLTAAGLKPQPQDTVSLIASPSLDTWARIYMVCVAVLVAPVVEELLFRGVALPALLKHVTPWEAVFWTSFAFAAAHFHLASFVPLFVMGASFSIGYVCSRSISVPILMHALFNSITLIHLLLGGRP